MTTTAPEIDAEFRNLLARWQRDRWALRALFTPAELRRLTVARRRVDKARRTIAVCAYENPFARSGGLFAVVNNLPPALQTQCRQALVLSPLHARLRTAPAKPEQPGRKHRGTPPPASPLQALGVAEVTFGGERVPLQLWEHVRDGVRWILFEAPGFFEAPGGPQRNNPYDYAGAGRTRRRRAPTGAASHAGLPLLARDSLLAAAAVPAVLAALGLREDVVVHLQDWQFAAAALTIKEALLAGTLHSAAVVLTSHNPYDHGLPAASLALLTKRTAARAWPRLRAAPRVTRRGSFYECMLPLLDAPVCTVSRNFAVELTTDPLQMGHFADHLQAVFARQGVVGVDNGLFLKLKTAGPFSRAAVAAARRGDPQPILAEKARLRRTMLEILDRHPPAGGQGYLAGAAGRRLSTLPDDVPVFLMFGRMDPNQKGFDVLARAIEGLPPGAARFVFAADVGGGVKAFARDLVRLAQTRPGDVLCYTHRMERGYFETMAGASYCVMPSMYEPFGGATEPFLLGTPVVARATGGLVQQVIDLDRDPPRATGLLYRETYQEPTVRDLGRQWHALLSAAGPQERGANPLYAALVAALRETLRRAIDVYQHAPGDYGRLLANVYDQALRFSWLKDAAEYGAVYDLATA